MKNIIITEEQLAKVIEKMKPISEDEEKQGSYMAKQQLFMIATLAHKMWEMMEEGDQLEDWMESKIAQSEAAITSVVKAFFYDDVAEKQKGMDKLDYNDIIIGN